MFFKTSSQSENILRISMANCDTVKKMHHNNYLTHTTTYTNVFVYVAVIYGIRVYLFTPLEDNFILFLSKAIVPSF